MVYRKQIQTELLLTIYCAHSAFTACITTYLQKGSPSLHAQTIFFGQKSFIFPGQSSKSVTDVQLAVNNIQTSLSKYRTNVSKLANTHVKSFACYKTVFVKEF